MDINNVICFEACENDQHGNPKGFLAAFRMRRRLSVLYKGDAFDYNMVLPFSQKGNVLILDGKEYPFLATTPSGMSEFWNAYILENESAKAVFLHLSTSGNYHVV